MLLLMIEDITPEHDYKLNELLRVIEKKITNPINPDKQKIIIFTAFADTAEYLYEHVSALPSQIRIGQRPDPVPSTEEPPYQIPADMNTILTHSLPFQGEALVMPKTAQHRHLNRHRLYFRRAEPAGLRLLHQLDIHWNSGAHHLCSCFGRRPHWQQKRSDQLVNFWPDLALDDYINLKERVEARMRISVMTATGDDDYINQDESGDLAYRRPSWKTAE